jgi:hypothetical protein
METGVRGHTVGRKPEKEGGMREYLLNYLSYDALTIVLFHRRTTKGVFFAYESLPITQC